MLVEGLSTWKIYPEGEAKYPIRDSAVKAWLISNKYICYVKHILSQHL